MHFGKDITMKLVSARFGFATNSSSSHSVVYNYSPVRSFDDVVAQYAGGETEFGWQEETYSDISSIVNYAALLIFGDYVRQKDDERAEMILDDLIDHEIDGEVAELLRKVRCSCRGWAYIDHQSAYMPFDSLPTLGERFKAFVMEVTSIETGNDNN
jgi:hypothetical protein